MVVVELAGCDKFGVIRALLLVGCKKFLRPGSMEMLFPAFWEPNRPYYGFRRHFDCLTFVSIAI